jgi:hypothetical protein
MPMKSPGNEGWIWHMNLSNEMAWLVVPLQTNQSNIEFTPLLENNSKVQADSALVEILIGGNIKYTANEEWSVVKDQTSNTSFIWKGAFVRAGASFALPPLNLTFPLDSTQKWGPSRAPVTITTEAKNTAPHRFMFWMLMLTDPEPATTNANAIKFGLFCPGQIDVRTNGEFNMEINFRYSKEQLEQTN